MLSEDPCPPTHPDLLLYDSWPGFKLMCYCEPSAEYSSGYNKDCGYTKGSTKCFEREAIPNMFLGSLEGYKICATRGAKPFKIAQRPVDIGGGILGCPTDTFACDEDAFANKTVTVD